jgi:Short C-terminal domain
MITYFFKAVFAMVSALAVIALGTALWGSYEVSGNIPSIPVIFFVAIAVLIVWRRTSNKSDSIELQNSSPIPDRKNVFDGHGATVEYLENCIAINRHGAASFLTQGMKGEKRIPFTSITAIQLKDARKNMSGYIQFSILGGVESSRGIWDATLDENTVMFTKEQSARFQELRDRIEERLSESHRQQSATPRASVADELSKLAELRANGILTEDEFAQQKAYVLAN